MWSGICSRGCDHRCGPECIHAPPENSCRKLFVMQVTFRIPRPTPHPQWLQSACAPIRRGAGVPTGRRSFCSTPASPPQRAHSPSSDCICAAPQPLHSGRDPKRQLCFAFRLGASSVCPRVGGDRPAPGGGTFWWGGSGGVRLAQSSLFQKMSDTRSVAPVVYRPGTGWGHGCFKKCRSTSTIAVSAARSGRVAPRSYCNDPRKEVVSTPRHPLRAR